MQQRSRDRFELGVISVLATQCLAYPCKIFIFPVPSTFFPGWSGLMASTFIGSSSSILVLMLIFLPLRLLFRLLFLSCHMTVIFGFVILTFVTHVIVAVAMHHFSGEPMFTTSIMHVEATKCSSSCLGLVKLLLWKENARN